MTKQVKKQIAQDVMADGVDGADGRGEAVVDAAADAAVDTALEAGGEALLAEGAELVAKEAVVGEIAGALASTGVGAPAAAALEAGMQIAVGDLAVTLAGAIERVLQVPRRTRSWRASEPRSRKQAHWQASAPGCLQLPLDCTWTATFIPK